MQIIASPAELALKAQARRIQDRLDAIEADRAVSRKRRANGYKGPLTRAEASKAGLGRTSVR
jgi:hypothetical protein